MTNETEFSTASGKKLLKSVTDKRVSRDAAIDLLELLESEGEAIAEKALEFADSAGRKTVRDEDIRRAIRVSQDGEQ